MPEDNPAITIRDFVFKDFAYQPSTHLKLTVACNVVFDKDIKQPWHKQKWSKQQAQEVVELIKRIENYNMYEVKSPLNDAKVNEKEFFKMGLSFSLTEKEAMLRTKGQHIHAPLELSEVIDQINKLKERADESTKT